MLVGGLTIKAMPGQPMTDQEIEAQLDAVAEAARALDYFTEDELEEAAHRR